MHCCVCVSKSAEVRPIFIDKHDVTGLAQRLNIDVVPGDMYSCQTCATRMAAVCEASSFATWVGYPCDACSQVAAFNDSIDGLPEGLVCADCTSPLGLPLNNPDRGVWLCITCFDQSHHGHRQKQLQPILDRLANL